MSKSFAELKEEVYAEMREILAKYKTVKPEKNRLLGKHSGLIRQVEDAYMREFMPEFLQKFPDAEALSEKLQKELEAMEELLIEKRKEARDADDGIMKVYRMVEQTKSTAPWVGFFDDLEKEKKTAKKQKVDM